MFESYKEAEIKISDHFLDDGNQVWDYVFRRLHTIWFHVVVRPSDEYSENCSKIFFLSGIDNLQLLQLDKSVTISELNIVIPGRMNGSKTWKMELLNKIMVGYEPEIEDEQKIIVYELNNGRRVIDSAMNTPEKDIIDLDVVFEMPISI
ncbi:MAG: hypothetical protein HN868_02115 [Gammaproteobacteria bacterium]|jgi:hypothetical protein|nr:hypothetical protein [Gammaproteobacteria bacterium]